MSIGTSQWLFDDRRTTASSSGEYHDSPVVGSTGSRAPGMSAQRNVWNVRTLPVSIGYFEKTARPNWPGKSPKPNASLPPPTFSLLSRSNPDGTPVFDGAVNECGYPASWAKRRTEIGRAS